MNISIHSNLLVVFSNCTEPTYHRSVCHVISRSVTICVTSLWRCSMVWLWIKNMWTSKEWLDWCHLAQDMTLSCDASDEGIKQTFAWRMLGKTIPAGKMVGRFSVHINKKCSRCNQEEDELHLFLPLQLCQSNLVCSSLVHQVWFISIKQTIVSRFPKASAK